MVSGVRLSAVLLVLWPVPAIAAESAAEPVTLAPGIKTGFIPPVLFAPEVVVHFPYVFAGGFFMLTNGGIGNGAGRSVVGGELGVETRAPGESTPYLSAALFHYEASKDVNGFYERSDMLALTAGGELKSRHFELQLGLGLLFTLNHETPPCIGWGCINISVPVLPAFDASLRYVF